MLKKTKRQGCFISIYDKIHYKLKKKKRQKENLQKQQEKNDLKENPQKLTGDFSSEQWRPEAHQSANQRN